MLALAFAQNSDLAARDGAVKSGWWVSIKHTGLLASPFETGNP